MTGWNGLAEGQAEGRECGQYGCDRTPGTNQHSFGPQKC